METIVETELDVLVRQSLNRDKVIMLYNDEVNSFENVINSLVKYCKHEPMQAEQIANIVHFKGKCDVKHGEMVDLLPVYTALLDCKLSVKIE